MPFYSGALASKCSSLNTVPFYSKCLVKNENAYLKLLENLQFICMETRTICS